MNPEAVSIKADPDGPVPPAAECSPEEARAFCRRMAASHYENFQVLSLLIPARLRQDFCNVYAYCRWADDLADESPSPDRAVQLLLDWRRRLDECYRGRALHPVFVALQETIRRFDIPKEPFDRLIDAFLQDQTRNRYRDWDQLLGYCRNSADPVGHLVLALFGYRDPRRKALADRTCTALQLVNFWQDVDRDLDKDRVYIPLEEMERFGYRPEDLLARRHNAAFAALMESLLERTGRLFQEGRWLIPLLEGRARTHVRLFSDCGERLIGKIRALEGDVFRTRPVLSKSDKLALLIRALGRELFHG